MRKTYKKNKAKNTRKYKSVRNKRRKRNYYLTGGAQFPAGLEYWNDFFNDDEKVKLNELRDYIQDLFTNTKKGAIQSFNDLCKMMQTLVPTFYVPKPPASGSGMHYSRGMLVIPNPNEFYYFNAILCVSFQLFGIIAYIMKEKTECKFNLIFKGGKAIQLILSNIFNTIENPTTYAREVFLENLHQTEDIDVALIPKLGKAYKKTDIQALAHNISKLIHWFLDHNPNTTVSILTPDDPKATNKEIFKLSYVSSGYRAFSDINFVPDTKSDFSDLESVKLKGLYDLDVLFECEKIEPLLKDKILYYTKYVYLYKNQNLISKEKPETNVNECIRNIKKFGKAIISLNNGLHLKKHPHLNEVSLKAKTDKYLKEELLSMDFSKINKEIPEAFLKTIIDIQQIIADLDGSGMEAQHSSSQPVMPSPPLSLPPPALPLLPPSPPPHPSLPPPPPPHLQGYLWLPLPPGLPRGTGSIPASIPASIPGSKPGSKPDSSRRPDSAQRPDSARGSARRPGSSRGRARGTPRRQ